MKKYTGVIIVWSVLAVMATAEEINSTNSTTKKVTPVFSATVNEAWASGWVPPTSWKSVYTSPVIQSEVNLELKTGLAWPQTARATVWVQNPLEGKGAFNPPAGEVDYALGLYGPTLWRINFSTEVRFIDLASAQGASVGNFGDNDVLRIRLRLERPFMFDGGVHTITPSLIYYRVEPVAYRPKVEGNVWSPQLNYDWRPRSWFKITAGCGFMYDDGEKGGIPAEIFSYWASAGVRIHGKYPECWLNGGIQLYDTLDHPSNRPNRNFDVISTCLTLKF